MADMTVIYYTANQEKEAFEQKIRAKLVENAGDLPIVSVSQKPIDLGINICVGTDVGVSGHNVYRQMQIGAMEAKTKWVCPAEADYLYPKEYFEFRPPTSNAFYVALPLYVLFAQSRKARVFALKSRGSEAAMVVDREFLIRNIETMLNGNGQWAQHGDPGHAFPYLFKVGRHKYFTTTVPLVTFKTDNQLHRKTPHDRTSKTRDLPYWGNSHDLLKEFALRP